MLLIERGTRRRVIVRSISVEVPGIKSAAAWLEDTGCETVLGCSWVFLSFQHRFACLVACCTAFVENQVAHRGQGSGRKGFPVGTVHFAFYHVARA